MAGDAGPEPCSFEKELDNLQRVVDLLERGELDLEEAILQYESGCRSLKNCRWILDDARKRIEILAGTSLPPGASAPPGPIPPGGSTEGQENSS